MEQFIPGRYLCIRSVGAGYERVRLLYRVAGIEPVWMVEDRHGTRIVAQRMLEEIV